jgi:hypothetical protein
MLMAEAQKRIQDALLGGYRSVDHFPSGDDSDESNNPDASSGLFGVGVSSVSRDAPSGEDGGRDAISPDAFSSSGGVGRSNVSRDRPSGAGGDRDGRLSRDVNVILRSVEWFQMDAVGGRSLFSIDRKVFRDGMQSDGCWNPRTSKVIVKGTFDRLKSTVPLLRNSGQPQTNRQFDFRWASRFYSFLTSNRLHGVVMESTTDWYTGDQVELFHRLVETAVEGTSVEQGVEHKEKPVRFWEWVRRDIAPVSSYRGVTPAFLAFARKWGEISSQRKSDTREWSPSFTLTQARSLVELLLPVYDSMNLFPDQRIFRSVLLPTTRISALYTHPLTSVALAALADYEPNSAPVAPVEP